MKSKANFDKLADFLDENYFDVQDMLAVVCATLRKMKQNKFSTKIMVGGQEFIIKIDKR